MKRWPGVRPEPSQPLEVLVHPAAVDTEAVAPTNPPPGDDDGGEIVTYTASGPAVLRFRPIDDRESMRSTLEGWRPMPPHVASPSERCLMPPCMGMPYALFTEDVDVELRSIDQRLAALESSSGTLPQTVHFPSAATAYLGVPQSPASLGKAVSILERSMLITDPGSAKELQRRVRMTRAKAEAAKSIELPAAILNELTRLNDETSNLVAHTTYLDVLGERLRSLEPLYAAAMQNATAVADAVNAAKLADNVSVSVMEALTAMDGILAQNAQDFSSYADDLRRRLAALESCL